MMWSSVALGVMPFSCYRHAVLSLAWNPESAKSRQYEYQLSRRRPRCILFSNTTLPCQTSPSSMVITSCLPVPVINPLTSSQFRARLNASTDSLSSMANLLKVFLVAPVLTQYIPSTFRQDMLAKSGLSAGPSTEGRHEHPLEKTRTASADAVTPRFFIFRSATIGCSLRRLRQLAQPPARAISAPATYITPGPPMQAPRSANAWT